MPVSNHEATKTSACPFFSPNAVPGEAADARTRRSVPELTRQDRESPATLRQNTYRDGGADKLARAPPHASRSNGRHDRRPDEKQQVHCARGIAAFHQVAEGTAQNQGRDPGKRAEDVPRCTDCCWPMAEVSPFCALETNRKEVPSNR